MEALGPYDLELVREFTAPPALVWEVWTTPKHLRKWFVPAPVELISCEVDLRVGGVFHSTMKLPDGTEMPSDGVYLEIVPQKKLVWTDCLTPGWRPSDEPFMTAALTLEAIEGGTRQTARALHADAETQKRHEEMGFYEGWGATADQMAELLKEIQK